MKQPKTVSESQQTGIAWNLLKMFYKLTIPAVLMEVLELVLDPKLTTSPGPCCEPEARPPVLPRSAEFSISSSRFLVTRNSRVSS